jgi:hypothetical protein
MGRHASPLLVAVSGPEVVETLGAVAAGGSCVAVVGFGAGLDVVVVAGVVVAPAVVGLAAVVVPVDAVVGVGVEVAVVAVLAADALGNEALLAELLEPQPLSTNTKHAI